MEKSEQSSLQLTEDELEKRKLSNEPYKGEAI